MEKLEPTDRYPIGVNVATGVFKFAIKEDRLRVILQDHYKNCPEKDGLCKECERLVEAFGVLFTKTNNDDDGKFHESLNNTIKNIDEIQKEARKKP